MDWKSLFGVEGYEPRGEEEQLAQFLDIQEARKLEENQPQQAQNDIGGREHGEFTRGFVGDTGLPGYASMVAAAPAYEVGKWGTGLMDDHMAEYPDSPLNPVLEKVSKYGIRGRSDPSVYSMTEGLRGANYGLMDYVNRKTHNAIPTYLDWKRNQNVAMR